MGTRRPFSPSERHREHQPWTAVTSFTAAYKAGQEKRQAGEFQAEGRPGLLLLPGSGSAMTSVIVFLGTFGERSDI